LTLNNILLTIAYDGSGFHGWQRQPGVRTVQGVLEEALTRVCGTPVTLDGTSRTDAGVHALGQCATLRGEFGIPTDRIPVAANHLLPDVRILRAEEKLEGFHARFDAAGKTYIYRFAIAPSLSVFLRNYACLLAKSPDLDKIKKAAKHMEGRHDFACFQAAGGMPRETTVRTIFALRIREGMETDPAGGRYRMIEVEVTGDGFLYNMVRILAGTLLEVGFGRIAPEEIGGILRSGDRARAGSTAPPQGLYLKEVYFSGMRHGG
jgi:tRNA pseudouridine38-40 synthase